MFDGLLKSKFYCKCKSDMKMIKIRVEMIKKKRNAMQKYLRNDVADLLKTGLDINAYGRVEGLLVELNRSECYEFIEQCTVHISAHLSAMNKQRECPEECREAVSSLMFAAARFADLPELRELRTIFSERYGNSVDYFVNKQFVEKLKSGLPSKDMKLQLLQDIALESGLEWNSKRLENKLYNDESTCEKDLANETNNTVNILLQKTDNSVQEKLNSARKSISPEEKTPRKEASFAPIKGLHEILKDMHADTVRIIEKQNKPVYLSRDPKEEEIIEKPLKFQSIPPPYTKSKKTAQPTEDLVEKTKRIPKSVRRRNVKFHKFGENEDISKVDESEKMDERNKETVVQGQRILKFFDQGGYDEQDEEEKIMDKLLRHYSRKNGPREKGKPGEVGPTKDKTKDVPNRSSSLPGESASPTETSLKGHNRAASLQPDMLNANVQVPPKSLDYDDFMARLAALKGK